MYAKKTRFSKGILKGDLLLNEKQKKPFVSLSAEVTIIHELVSTSGKGAERARFEFVYSLLHFNLHVFRPEVAIFELTCCLKWTVCSLLSEIKILAVAL